MINFWVNTSWLASVQCDTAGVHTQSSMIPCTRMVLCDSDKLQMYLRSQQHTSSIAKCLTDCGANDSSATIYIRHVQVTVQVAMSYSSLYIYVNIYSVVCICKQHIYTIHAYMYIYFSLRLYSYCTWTITCIVHHNQRKKRTEKKQSHTL